MSNIKKINLDEKIFVAGASGMAGSAIIRMLENSGYGKKLNNGEILKPNSKQLNLLNNNDVDLWFKVNKPTVVIIAAAKVGGIFANSNQPADFLLKNLKIQNNLIEYSYKYRVKRLLFLGSSCIYPKFSQQPIREEYLLTGTLEATNEWYAIAKIAGIKLCQALRKQYDFDAISLMPTNLYGPKDNYHSTNSHVMASLIRKFCEAKKVGSNYVTCWGTGKPLREFMHVDDLGKSVIFALENWDPKDSKAPLDIHGEPLTYLNVGTGKDISIKELAKKISKIVNFKGEILWDNSKPDGTPKKQLNIDKFQSLGWYPTIKLDDGIKRTINEFKV